MPLLATLLLVLTMTACATTGSNHDLLRLRELKDRAFAGDPQSQYQLGLYYSSGAPSAWDRSRGHSWFLDAAETSHADAQYMAGMGYLLGRGAVQSTTKAVYWLELAATQGHARSQFQLGRIYLEGDGIAAEESWGRQWLEQAAWRGHAEAQFLLGALFYKGIGGQPNRSEALHWLTRARLNKHPQAATALANLELSTEERDAGERLIVASLPKEGSQLLLGPQLRYLQSRLNQQGFGAGPEDGLKGSQTEAAINAYLDQQKKPRGTPFDQLIGMLRGH